MIKEKLKQIQKLNKEILEAFGLSWSDPIDDLTDAISWHIEDGYVQWLDSPKILFEEETEGKFRTDASNRYTAITIHTVTGDGDRMLIFDNDYQSLEVLDDPEDD